MVMSQKEAYEYGKEQGLSTAQYFDPSPEIDLDLPLKEIREELVMECHEAEHHSRQYSPWEFFASSMNEHQTFQSFELEVGDFVKRSEDPDDAAWRIQKLWEKYEDGVTVGIQKGLRLRFGG